MILNLTQIYLAYFEQLPVEGQREIENVIWAFLQLTYANVRKTDRSSSRMLSGFS